MHWRGAQDRLIEEQLAFHKRHLVRMSDMELQRSFEMYLRALQLDKGSPPSRQGAIFRRMLRRRRRSI